MHTDASRHVFGAILLKRKSDNKLHPVFFYSYTEVENLVLLVGIRSKNNEKLRIFMFQAESK